MDLSERTGLRVAYRAIVCPVQAARESFVALAGAGPSARVEGFPCMLGEGWGRGEW